MIDRAVRGVSFGFLDPRRVDLTRPRHFDETGQLRKPCASSCVINSAQRSATTRRHPWCRNRVSEILTVYLPVSSPHACRDGNTASNDRCCPSNC